MNDEISPALDTRLTNLKARMRDAASFVLADQQEDP
jgi:hypothetical protein